MYVLYFTEFLSIINLSLKKHNVGEAFVPAPGRLLNIGQSANFQFNNAQQWRKLALPELYVHSG